MRRAASSEWIKLLRPGMLAAFVAAAAAATLGTVVTVLGAGNGSSKGGLATTHLSLAELISSQGLGDALSDASLLLGVITLGVVAASVAGEYSQGTVRNLLIRQPHRLQLLMGKLLGLAVAIAVSVVLASVIAIVGAVVAGAGSKGINLHAWATGSGIGHLLAAEGELIASTLGWGLLGALLAIVFRSPVAAIGVGVAYALPLESILAGISGGVSRWLPGKLLTAIAAGGNSTASLVTAAFTIAVYAAIALAVCAWLFAERDVTA